MTGKRNSTAIEHIPEDELRNILTQACTESGSQQDWAKGHGFSPAYVSDVLNGRKDVSERIAEALGYVKFTGFYKKKD
jgi:hypothetical protein